MDVSYEGATKSSGPSHVYLNVSAVNADPGINGLGRPVRATFTESRSTPLIENSSDYDMSVVRFTASGIGSTLPLWIPQIETGQSNVNKTIYQLAVVTPIATVTVNLIWKPVYTDPIVAPIPQPPLTTQDLSSYYYFASTYVQFADMFNGALQGALTQLGLSSFTACEIAYSGGGYFAFTLDAAFNVNNGGNPIPTCYLQLNPPLANLLYTFNTAYGKPEYYGATPLGTFQPGFYTLLVPRFGNSASPDSIISYMTCDTPCTQSGLWNPVDSYAFVSNFLPIVPEQGTLPNILGERNIGPSGVTGAGFTNIISDIAFQGAPENALTSVLYVPTAEYRITSLAPNMAIANVDFTLLWRYRLTGQLLPVYLPNNASMTLKVLFRRKDWQK